MNLDSEILNIAVDLSLEWGEWFLKPVNNRLRERYPQLGEEEAESYNRLCKEIREYAFAQIEMAYTKQIPNVTAIQNIRVRYPLLNQDSINRLNNQGTYYAWKDNG